MAEPAAQRSVRTRWRAAALGVRTLRWGGFGAASATSGALYHRPLRALLAWPTLFLPGTTGPGATSLAVVDSLSGRLLVHRA